MDTALIIGCGDVGRQVGRKLTPQRRVIGVTRTAATAQTLSTLGIEGVALDLDREAPAHLPLAGSLVFYFAPPPDRGETDPRLRAVLDVARANRPARVVYISTSGVYGDCAGGWVTEDAPANPVTSRAKRRWDAEQQLQAFRSETGGPVVILRVGGIYGPGRLPAVRLREGLAVICPEEAPWSNRIHIEDLASVCIAAADRGKPGAVYNVADDSPSTMTDYFYRVADALGLPRPPCVPLAQAAERLSPAMLSYIAESRRLDNRRLHQELGIVLRYPSLSEGLPASLDGAQ